MALKQQPWPMRRGAPSLGLLKLPRRTTGWREEGVSAARGSVPRQYDARDSTSALRAKSSTKRRCGGAACLRLRGSVAHSPTFPPAQQTPPAPFSLLLGVERQAEVAERPEEAKQLPPVVLLAARALLDRLGPVPLPIVQAGALPVEDVERQAVHCDLEVC